MAENKHTKRRSDPLEWVKQKAAEVAAKAEQKAAETPRQMFLPGMDEFMRAMPTEFVYCKVATREKSLAKLLFSPIIPASLEAVVLLVSVIGSSSGQTIVGLSPKG